MKKTRLVSSVLAAMTLASLPAIPAGAADGVCINEICSQNKACLPDSAGKYPDWIELYNSAGTSFDLSGWGLSDNEQEPMKFVFPDVTVLAPREHLVVFAGSGESSGSELRTGFSISKNGETLFLSDPSGKIVQQVTVPTLGEDQTYGRTPDGSDTMEIMSPTPGKENAQVLSAPVFSQKSGFYGSELNLQLTAASGTQIYYTTDGSDPATSNTAQLYSGGIQVQDRTNQPNLYSAMSESESAMSICRGIGYKAPSYNVDKGMVVRAVAKDQSGRVSACVSETYFIANGNLNQYRGMTVVSLVANPDDLFSADKGIYVTGNQYMTWRNSGAYDPNKSIWDTDNVCNYFSHGKDWERKADITIFENGEAVVQQGMGIRIKGASTRNHAQKSFNLYARSEYGASKIEYPLFQDNYGFDGKLIDKYDSITLRSLIDETRLNDSLSQGLLADREDLALQKMKPCVVFLNGEYWGMYAMAERISDYFIESKYDVRKQDVAIIKNSEPEEGPDSECADFIAFADKYSAMDLSNAANYKAVCDYIDMDSMIDHYAAGLYLGTYDWPNRNYGAWRYLGAQKDGNPWSDGKWRFITFDLDYTLGTTYADFGGVEGYAYNSFRHMEKEADEAPTNLFVALLKNPDFRAKFAQTYSDYANEIATAEKGIARANEYSQKYTDMIAQSLLRWWGFYGDSPSGTLAWNKENYQNQVIGGIRTFFQQRAGNTTQHMQQYLGISGNQQTITVSTKGNGKVRVSSMTVSGKWSGKYYSDVPVTLTALPDAGNAFAGWSNGETAETITVTLKDAVSLTAEFTEQKQVQGDVNADGRLSIADVVMMQKYLLGTGKLTDWQAGDLCKDGRITASDLSALKRRWLNA